MNAKELSAQCEQIRQGHPHLTDEDIAELLNRTPADNIKNMYPHLSTKEIHTLLNRSAEDQLTNIYPHLNPEEIKGILQGGEKPAKKSATKPAMDPASVEKRKAKREKRKAAKAKKAADAAAAKFNEGKPGDPK